MSEAKYQLPQKIEQYLASLSKVYEVSGKKDLQALLVNAEVSLQEVEYDNWNGGQTGFLLHLNVPVDIFTQIIANKDGYEQEINQDVSKLINIPGEYITSVSIEMNLEGNHDWREKSGLKVVAKRVVSAQKQNKIWETDYLRVFLSHKAEFKEKTGELKEALAKKGISAFVAHDDIEPTAEWQTTIEEALFTMDVFVALMTEGFHDSNWTDQEVGIAIGREVPIVSIRLGKDPYGFIGKYQAMQGKGKNAQQIANELFEIMTNRSEIKEKLKNAIIDRFYNADSYDQANWSIQQINNFDKLSSGQIKLLEDAHANNGQVRGAWRVRNMLPGVIRKFREAIQ